MHCFKMQAGRLHHKDRTLRRFAESGRLVQLVVECFDADAEFLGRFWLVAVMAIQGSANGLHL